MDERTQPVDLTTLRAALHAAPVGSCVVYHDRVASTMPIGHALAADDDIPAGAVVIAEEQTSGRGRVQRRWNAPRATALLISVVVKEPLLPADPAALPMIAGLAVARSLSAAAAEVSGQVALKWPNDVLLLSNDGTVAKVAGILIETSFRQGTLDHAVVGIGINVNQAAAELPVVPADAPQPASLYLRLGRPLDRTRLLIELCHQLSALLNPGMAQETVYAEWRQRLHTLGRRVKITAGSERADDALVGLAADVTAAGELVVIDGAGRRHVISAGDVSIRTGV